MGIGQVCSNILELSQSYSSAREAVSYRVIYGASRAINIKEIAPQEMSKSDAAGDSELSELFKMIRLKSAEEITQAVNKYLDHISFPAKSLQQHHIDIMELVSALYRFSANNDIASDDFSGDMRTLYSGLLDLGPTIFKKETGNSFIGYLTDYRMDRASRLLIETNEKSYIIAKNVGYTDPNYFSYVFKRRFGVSPSKYRTEHTESEK